MPSMLDRPQLLEPVVSSGRSRAIAAGVDACEYDTITSSLGSAGQWTAAFRRAGAVHLDAAKQAETGGNLVSAGDAYLAAAACFHISTTVPTEDHAGHIEAADAMQCALALIQPSAYEVTGATFRGTFTPNTDDASAPLVVVVPGLDSSRAEFHSNCVALQRRGLATLAIDGPGQGALAPVTTLCSNYDAVVSEALDLVLATAPAPRSIGMMALSLGGFYGALALAHDQRVRVGVTVSGPSAMTWTQLPELLQQILVVRAGSREAASSFVAQIDVAEFAAEISQSLLVVDGANDIIPGFTNGSDLARLAPRAEHLLVPEGDHLVGNRRWLWLPHAADYLQRELNAVSR